MLDAETKARIDSARDILVGKVPDPKSQVEQITIALIYKFMDDMDRQSEEIGGKATFFTGKFKKYRWPILLDKRFGGNERLLLYGESIEKMEENANIPQLFRDIFRGVFLPYRDPETLNLFLKEIDGFTYDHSERLGDAYEYLLSVLGTQGDAGQFRTPRHIIDFIVAVVDPQKHETVLDPACGTAGFLISAFKSILKNNEDLTPDERERLMTNFRGYDIAPDMVRLSRVNLYLHGFPNPVIHEYDTLTSEDRWDERCDVIMANPPFMTPKGGIRPHSRFAIRAKRSEVLFVDYIAEPLNPGGRAGIIVPEGIIFQGQNAYKALRKMLVENYLWAVVSLPAGVFNPYSGVKTSILFLDRNMANRADELLFVKIENDGFDLGAQRRPVEGSDLPEGLKILIGHKKAQKAQEGKIALTVSRNRLIGSGEVNLSGERYRETAVRTPGKWPIAKLGDVLIGKPQYGSGARKAVFDGKVRYIRITDIDAHGNLRDDAIVSPSRFEDSCILKKGDFVIARSGSVGRAYLHERTDLVYQFAGYLIRFPLNSTKILPGFLFHVTTSTQYWSWIDLMRKNGTLSNINAAEYCSLEIPLPPLDEQERIVAELDGHRKVIEGARQVIDNYKPTMRMNPKWPTGALADICSFEYGFTAKAQGTGHARFIRITDIGSAGELLDTDVRYVRLDDEARPYLLAKGDVLVARTGATYGKTLLFDGTIQAVFASYLIRLRFKLGSLLPAFFAAFSHSEAYWRQARALVTGGGQPQFNSNAMKQLVVPLPPLDIQRQIMHEVEAERALVESNRKLIEVFEKKIQAKLAEIWGEEETATERTRDT